MWQRTGIGADGLKDDVAGHERLGPHASVDQLGAREVLDLSGVWCAPSVWLCHEGR